MLEVKSKMALISNPVQTLHNNNNYEKRDGIHGVKYCNGDDGEGWTPVVGKRKRRRVPLHCLRLRAQTISPNESDTESSDTSDIDLTIPERANVNFPMWMASLACS